jgi:hypothetical protein
MTGLESLSPKQRATAQRVIAEAKAQGVPAELAYGMAMQESGFDQSKKSKTGPTGVMMLGKAAAKDMGVNRYNEMENIRGGVAYMKQMLDKYQGDVDKALIAYHDGPNSAYFKNGQASPAAINHIQKVKGYAGMATPTTSVVKVPPAQEGKSRFNIELEDVEPLDVTGLAGTTAPAQGFGRQRDISDVMVGGAGAAAGFAFGPDKPMSKKRMDQMRIQIAADRAARDAQAQAQAAATAKTTQFGSGKDAWIANQHDPLLAQPLFGQPSQAAAGAAEPAARAQLQKAQAMFPNMAPAGPDSLIALPNTVGQGNKILPATVAAPAPAGGLPVTQPKPINFGSRPGQLANTVAGGVIGAQVNDMSQRAAQGDYGGAALAGLSAAGAGATLAPNPKAKIAGALTSALGAGAQKLYDIFKTEDETKSVLQPTGEPPKYKKGGAIKKPDGGLPAVEHFDGGGRTGIAKAVAGKIAGAFGQGPGQLIVPTAEEIAKFAPKPTQQLKFSDAIRPYQDQYLGVHMSDRQGVHGNRWGGTGFPNFQNINPLHAANKAVWMNDSEEAANRLIQSARQFNGRPMINTNYVGGLDQHKSNKTVFNDVLDTFYKRQATGAIPEDQINTINEAIRNLSKTQGTIKKRPFNDVFDIRDPDAVKAIAGTTFEGRKAISDILGKGEGTGRQFKQTPAVPDYWNIIDSHADPLTKGAPTSAVGTRLFSVDDVPAYFAKEELHPDYRWAVTGSDKQVQFPAVPQKVAVPDWYNKYYEKFKRDPHGNAWFSYPDQPQLISKDYITMAEDAGYAEGGQVQHFDRGGKVGALTRIAESAYDMLKLTPEKVEAWRKANAKPYKQQQDPQLAQALEAYMTGKISQADYLRIMNERRPIRPLTEVPTAHSNIDIVSALDKNKADKGILGLNLQVPEGMRVGNRLDIPAYERYGTYVDTMHDPAGKPIGYGHTGHLKDVEFQSDPNKAIRVGLGTREQALTPLSVEEGSNKGPFAMMMGNQQTTKDEEVRRMLAEALKDPTWRQIGMNPYRGSQFYDKADMQPVWSAAEKIQAGPLVLARDVEKTSWKDPRLKTKYGVNYAKGGLTHL